MKRKKDKITEDKQNHNKKQKIYKNDQKYTIPYFPRNRVQFDNSAHPHEKLMAAR